MSPPEPRRTGSHGRRPRRARRLAPLADQDRREDLAGIARAVAADWGITIGERFPSAHSFIAAVGDNAILKVVRPDIPEYDHEPDALALWGGDHAVRLIRRDPTRRALLVERALPGYDLSGVSEAEAIVVANEVGRSLWRRVPDGSPFRDVVVLSRAWLAEVAELDPQLVGAARGVLDTIQIRMPRLVHGDLHHHNVLRRRNGWAAIDPQPAVGEPEYDVATFLWNPIRTPPSEERTSRWLSAFAAAGLDLHRMREWAVVRGTILSFSSQPGRRHEPQLQVARSLL